MFYEFEFFTPSDFLKLSEELLDNLNDFDSGISVVKRTIYNRTYYSVFLQIREWLIANCSYNATFADHSDIS